MGSKIKSSSLAYDYILNEIATLQLRAGSPVIEQQIADALHLSRTPVREAIKQLETEGILKSIPYQGTLVASFSSDDVREICGLRKMIEMWALKEGFYRITEEEADAVDRLLDECFQKGEPEDNYPADRALHKLITDKAQSKRLNNMLELLNRQTDFLRLYTTQSSKRFPVSYKEHKEIVKYMKERNYEKCADCLSRHLDSVKEGFVEALKESQFL